jgi:outer membrane immunogenic protein
MPDDPGRRSVEFEQKGQAMRLRSLLCGLVFVGIVQSASAADLGDSFLRGSTVISQPGGNRWDGVYFGAHVGAATSGADFSGTTKDLVGTILRESTFANIVNVPDWRVLGKANTTGSSFGGFIGYNTQWDGAILGIEGTYNRTSLAMLSTDSIALQPVGLPDTVLINATAGTKITDYGTLRVRGGVDAGTFMPYGFFGLAIGRADVVRTATVSLFNFSQSPTPYFTDTRSDNQTGAFAYGYALGFGMDMCIWNNLFVRGEYEYVKFGEFNNINMHIQTVRIGAGLKF